MSAFGIGKFALGAAAATAVLALVAGCASSGGSPSTTSSSRAPLAGAAGGLTTRSTSIGTVLVDPSGRTVYELVGDSATHQTCTGGCLAVWPAVRTNGSQAVVNGHPVFTFAGDKAAGQTNGQNVTDQWGRWLALDASGNPVGTATPTAPSSHASTSKSKAPGGGGPAV